MYYIVRFFLHNRTAVSMCVYHLSNIDDVFEFAESLDGLYDFDDFKIEVFRTKGDR